jgi:hypothetical protein
MLSEYIDAAGTWKPVKAGSIATSAEGPRLEETCCSCKGYELAVDGREIFRVSSLGGIN